LTTHKEIKVQLGIPESKINKNIDNIQIVMLGLLALLFLSELVLSLNWRMQHDTPLYHYSAFLINEHGCVPYKDIFETSFVGTFLFHSGICSLFGYGDLAFRLVDIVCLLLLSGVTWFLLRPLGKFIALTSILLFGILYLSFGPSMSLQRDYIGVLPVAAAALLATRSLGFSKIETKALVIGALFALSASIKPHLAIGMPAIIIYMSFSKSEKNRSKASSRKQLSKLCLFATLGFVSVFALPFLWLWKKGGFPYFWEMATSYLPLHLQLTGNHFSISGVQRWNYLFQKYREFGGMQGLFIPTCLGMYLALTSYKKNTPKRKLVLLLFTLLLLYSIYPVFAGQFWDYHWIPFIYFGCLCASLIMLPIASASSPLYKRIVPLICLVILMLTMIHYAPDFRLQISGHPPAPPKRGRVDEIASYLKEHLRPGDKVQPLDWTGGVIHGMLISEALIATPYILDYYFYHHVSHPFIQELRRRLIKELEEGKPRYIIYMAATPRPKGEDTSRRFPKLLDLIDKNYSVAYEGNRFTIYEIKDLFD